MFLLSFKLDFKTSQMCEQRVSEMKQQYLKNVVTLRLDPGKCAGCGMCLVVCPHNVFKLEDGKAMIQDRDSCMECGACAKNCPFGAVSVRAGVGCAFAIVMGKLRGTEPTCGCGESDEN
jgi:NAD-dependent dihydropyrimidine dehydrogenase PreA subunit